MKATFSLENILFNINYPDTIEYIAHYFIPDASPCTCNIVINSTISFQDYYDYNKGKKLSNTLWITPDNCLMYIFSGDLWIKIIKASQTSISSQIYINNHKIGLRKKISNIFSKTDTWLNVIIVQALRHAILYPFFLLMKLNKNVFLSHGAAFSINNEGYGIVGFDGIGKSSIVSEAMKTDAYILSDNFLLFDEEYIYFIPDPLRMLVDSGGIFWGKNFVKLNYVTSKVSVHKIIYTYLGSNYTISRLTHTEITNINNSIVGFLPEFNDYEKYLAAICMLNQDMSTKLKYFKLPDLQYYQCERSSIDDNRRILSDVMSI